MAAGAGLSMLTFIGWAAERWGGEGGGSGHQVQRIPGMARRPRRGGGGGGGSKWKKKKRAERSKKTPEAKMARIRQEVKQVLTWMEKMERFVPGLPQLNKVALGNQSPSSNSDEDGDRDGKEESGGVVPEDVGAVIRKMCGNRVEEEWDPANTASDPARQRVEGALVAFARDADRQRTAFSRSLSSFERYAVYETSERLGLTHRKVGDAIVVSKLKFELPPFPGSQNGAKIDGEDGHEEARSEGEEEEDTSVSLERCKILEECLTMALLDLDSLVEREEAVPREERKSLVTACQQLLAALDAWKAHLQRVQEERK